jgi:hypothetical protein
MVGELDAGNPHVQFDEGAQETCDNAARLCPTLPKPLLSVPPLLLALPLEIARIEQVLMAKHPSKSPPKWADVKAKLASFDRTELLNLVQNLYAAHKDNQTFLHTRFGLVEDVLGTYKQTIARWLYPDIFQRQDTTSVAKAKQAIADYKKAVGDPAGVAELMVYFCERGAGFCNDVGNDDYIYLGALVRMFGQALGVTKTLPDASQVALIARLERVRGISHRLGYGVGEDIDRILAGYLE